jgi:hypothetical protein
MVIAIAIYLVLTVVAGLFGARRILGFWGTLVLSVILTPLVTIVVLLLTAPRRDVAVGK